jgi:hypothetical protein
MPLVEVSLRRLLVPWPKLMVDQVKWIVLP